MPRKDLLAEELLELRYLLFEIVTGSVAGVGHVGSA